MEGEPNRQTILVIDDAPDVLMLLSNLLRDHYDVRVANRGDTGIRLASAYPLPSLILLDIIMPGIDGYEVINVLKSDPVTSSIPVIFLTGRTEEGAEEKGLLLGAVDYIVKPINPTVLLARVKNHLVIHAYRNFLKDKNAYLEEEVRRRSKDMMESEQRLRHFVLNTPLGVIELDRYFRVVAWNKSSERIFGYARLEALGLDIASLLLRNYNISTADQIRDLFLERKGEFFTLENETKDGKHIICEWYNTPLTDVKGDFVGVMSLVNDITRRTRAEQDRERLARATENLAEMVVITDSEGSILYVNPAFTRITGYSNDEARGRNPRILKSSHQDALFYKKLWDTIKAGETWRGRLVNKKKDGTLYEEESTIASIKDEDGRIINFVAVKRDVTEELMLERQLRQAQKMEAIGTLAGGIAHDFNNILSVIFGYTELALDSVEGRSMTKSHLESVLNAADRARQLIRRILTISRQQEQEVQTIRLTPLIKETVQFLRASLPATIDIRLNFAAGNDTVCADPTQIHQLLMNLCTNAWHAMRDKGGTLGISLETMNLEEQAIIGHSILKSGEYVRLSVSDTGCGIAPEHIDRIFEPYFTTKQVGEGTGLGLAVVHAIVKKCGGDISVYSEPGKGTVFHVYLPLAEEEEETEAPNVTEYPGGSESILFVDDEEPIVDAGVRILNSLGYKAHGFTDPRKAVEAVRESPGSYDLVITDKTMPGLTGFELSSEVKKINPEIPVALITGLKDKSDLRKTREAGIDSYVLKPLHKKELAEVVRKALDNRKNIERYNDKP